MRSTHIGNRVWFIEMILMKGLIFGYESVRVILFNIYFENYVQKFDNVLTLDDLKNFYVEQLIMNILDLRMR